MKKAYVSCPLTVDWNRVVEVQRKLVDMDCHPKAYTRGCTYTDVDLKHADIFILITPNNQFDMQFADLTPGCQKELTLAQSLGKSLYLAYWKKAILHIYPTHMDKLPGRILGMNGCSISQFAPQITNIYPIY